MTKQHKYVRQQGDLLWSWSSPQCNSRSRCTFPGFYWSREMWGQWRDPPGACSSRGERWWGLGIGRATATTPMPIKSCQGSASDQTRHIGMAARLWHCSFHSCLCTIWHGRACRQSVVNLPALEISAIMVGTHFRAKPGVSTEKGPRLSDAYTQRELVRRETSVHAGGWNQCSDPSPRGRINTWIRCAQVNDLLRQVAELQETANRLCRIREAETEIDKWFRTMLLCLTSLRKNEAPRTLLTNKSRTLLQSSPSSTTIKTRHKALTAVDTHEQGLDGETVPATHMDTTKGRKGHSQ